MRLGDRGARWLGVLVFALVLGGAAPLVSGPGAAASEGGGTLTGTLLYTATDSETPPKEVDLTAEGYEDWAVWGYADGGRSTSLVPDLRKDGGGAIGALTDVTNEPPTIPLRGIGQFANELPFRFSWADGPASDPVGSSEPTGIQHDANGVDSSGFGFRFTVPAGVVPQRLTVWVHAQGGVGKLTAALSDGSAPEYVDTHVGNGGHNAPGVYRLDFAAASPDQTLTVTWTLDHVVGSLGGGNSSTNNAALYAVALSRLPDATELVANGGFESPAGDGGEGGFDTYPPTPDGFAWTVSGSIDHIGHYWSSFEGDRSIDLDGDFPGAVEQTLATKPGAQYLVRFAYAANPARFSESSCTATGAHMQVLWGGQPLGAYAFDTENGFTDMKWRTVEVVVDGAKTTGAATKLRFESTDCASPWGIALDAVSVKELPSPAPPVTLGAPAIVRAVTNGTAVALTGRVPGGAGVPVTLAVRSSATCSGGVLGGTPSDLGTLAVSPGADTYFTALLPVTVPLRAYLTVQATAPGATDASACAVVGGENDSWPRAFDLDPTGGTSQDVVDSAGQSRWYAFAVRPGMQVTVKLTGLPADYDLTLFKDISQAYTQLTSPADLTRLSAEFAPSAFSPSAFSPSAFSPSAFSPDAYSPSAFSPSAFSAEVYSPSAFSPSAFSPSAFSPSAFSPSAFSPSAFSPSAFSPSAFSPSAFSPDVFDPEAFASAQTRSLVAVSATPGTADELTVANTWNNTGRYYVRVAGRDGSFSTDGAFTVTATKSGTSCASVAPIGSPPASEPAGAFETVILTDLGRIPGTAAERSTLQSRLATFAARPDVRGAVVDLAGDARVTALNAQADANAACPYAKNLVAGAIKDVVDAYRAANPGLRYVVLVGGDGVIPFFRYPDESLLGQESGYVPPVGATTASEASLRLDYVLGQDAYGATHEVSLRSTDFPVPDLAVGRIVETASEASGMLDAYTATNGVVTPHSSLVTGYDFLADVAADVRDDLAAGTAGTPDTLITPASVSPQDPQSWTAAQLQATLLGSQRHDLVFLAGHFSANSALAADFTTSLLTTDLAASTTDFRNAIVFSAGCHSGYTIVDSDAVPGVTQTLDWTQAFARKQATLVAGTGYQYGDTDFVEYSERIYREFARQLRTGTGPVSVGEALVRSKQAYLDSTPDIRGIHEKALLEATVFGLPMLRVDMPGGHLPAPSTGSAVGSLDSFGSNPGLTLGLKSFDLPVTPSLTPATVALANLAGGTITATYYRGGAGVVTNPAEPALPLESIDVTPPDPSLVLRGVGFRGGSYADSAVTPLTGAPTTELRGVHAPFVSPVFYPMRLATPTYFGALGGGATRLLVTPAQHRALSVPDGTSTLRLYSGLSLRLFYSGWLGPAALSAAPNVVDVGAVPNDGGGVDFRTHVVGNPAAGIQQVWVTYTGDGPSRWASLDLTQDATDSTLWTGTLPGIANPAALRFMVQAVNGVGLVTLDDALGSYHRVTTAGSAAPAATALHLQSPPAGGTYGDGAPVSALLTSGGSPLAGKTVILAVGGSSRVVTTGADGIASASVPLVSTAGPTQVTASFGGDDAYLPSGDSAPFTIAKAPTALAAFPGVPVVLAGDVLTTLTATLGGKQQPLLQQTVTLAFTGAATRTFSTITDYLGRVRLPAGLAAGTYSLTASFAGDPTYAPATRTGTFKISSFSGFLAPVDNPPTLNVVKGGSAVPVKFSLGGDRGLAILAPGSPTVVTVACGTAVPTDAVETTVTANASGLQYDAASGTYTYVWKTTKGWTGCRRLDVTFVDGATYSASFKFQ